ncbi:unnamed protein product [Ascophyllum nodosum]
MTSAWRQRTVMTPGTTPQFEGDEDWVSSQPWVWLPGTVVRKDRRRAIAIWITLLAAFSIYIAYIIWETVESRANPASSVEMKQEPFKIPDMAFCMSWLEGCLNFGYNSCFYPGVAYWSSAGNFGFLNDLGNFTEDERSLAIEEEYPACRVIPFSRLEVNQTGVDNGDINYFSASLYFLWDEDPYHNYEITDFKINTQFVKVFFIDIDKDVKTIGEEILDAKLPYDRINITTDEGFVITKNHMVLTMTEFVGISTSNGAKQKPERTYFQQITSGKQNWWWTGIDGNGTLFSFLSLEITIDKFEYTRIVEIDPVDGWAIIGSIGGVWQFVVLGFGLFFVYAEKQRPDMKMRNMKKTMLKPASVVTQRLSIASSKSSDQDVVVDASDEDLPVEWVKRLRNNGSFYYYNSMTGAMQRSRPDERIETNNATGAPAVPQRSSLLTRAFQTPHKNPLGASDGANQRTAKSHENNDQGNERLPPGWIVRRNDQGRTYYMNTILKTTQWQRPTQYVASNHGTGVRAVDTPAARSRESLTSSFSDVHESKQQEQARDLDDPVGAFPSAGTAPSAVSRLSVSAEDTSLPPNWEKRVNQDGKIYYANSVTRKTQWEPPHL